MNQLDFYLGRLVLRLFLLALAGLTVLFSLLDFVQSLSLVGQGRFSAQDAWACTICTAPGRALQLAPIAMLLATLLGLGLLARNAELIAWRSLGLSPARITGAVLKISLPIIVVLVLVAQYAVPPGQRAAQRIQAGALGPAATALQSGGFWAAADGNFLSVRRFSAAGAPQGIEWLRFAPDGSLVSDIHAASADILPGGAWQLHGVEELQVQNDRFLTSRTKTLVWTPFLPPAQLRLLQLPPAAMPPVELYTYIQAQKRAGRASQADELVFWSMAAIPASLLALVLAAAPFAFGPPRRQSAGGQLLTGALLGIGFALAQQLLYYFGLRLGLPPPLTALAPALLLAAYGLQALQRGL